MKEKCCCIIGVKYYKDSDDEFLMTLDSAYCLYRKGKNFEKLKNLFVKFSFCPKCGEKIDLESDFKNNP